MKQNKTRSNALMEKEKKHCSHPACGNRPIDHIGLPERSLAFLLYIMRITDGIKMDREDIVFTPVKEKFGAAEARWATVFGGNDGVFLEYWIIYIDDEPMAVAQKIISTEGVDCAFFQLVIKDINMKGVTKLIESLPFVTSLTAEHNKFH